MVEKQTVKFGDICREVKLTTKNPIVDGYDKYIGLDHLDSGSLKIKRWGNIAEDNPSFTRVFMKGHILFGKRRSYLRKAAIAEFDGVCSGDIIVMEPKGNLLLPELLPFIVQSDTFWDWAVKTSSGSLSPRTKFQNLADFSISIGNQGSQLAIARIGANLLNLEEQTIECLESAEDFYKVIVSNLTSGRGYEYTKLNSICSKIQDGTHFSPKSKTNKGEFLYVTSKNIRMGEMIFPDQEFISATEHLAIYSRCDVKYGDILLTKDGANTGNCCINQLTEAFSLLSSVALIRVDPAKADRDFVFHWLCSPIVQRTISAQMAGNAITRLTLGKIKSFKFPMINLETQKKHGEILNYAAKVIFTTKNKLIELSNLKRTLIGKL